MSRMRSSVSRWETRSARSMAERDLPQRAPMGTEEMRGQGQGRWLLLHFAFELFEEDIVSFQLFEDEGEGLEGLAADVVLHAFDVAVDGFGVETEAGEEAGEDVVAMGDGLADGAALVGKSDPPIALINQ